MKMKVLDGGLGQRFPVVRLVLCVILVLVASGGLPAPARAAGIITHQEIAERALASIRNPELRRLLEDHWDAVDSGAAFPDWGYLERFSSPPIWEWYTNLSEVAHNRDFRDEYINYLKGTVVDRPPAEKDHDAIAFLFGLISHQETDWPWHADDGFSRRAASKDLPLMIWDLADPLLEYAADMFVSLDYGERYDDVVWVYPVEALQGAYFNTGYVVSEGMLYSGRDGQHEQEDFEKRASQYWEDEVERLNVEGPDWWQWLVGAATGYHWTYDHLDVPGVKGNIPDAVNATVRAWEQTWDDLSPLYCVKVTGVTISGPTEGGLGSYTFTAAFEPANASPPAWAWDNGDTSMTTTRELTTEGPHAMTVKVTDCSGGLATASHTVTVRSWDGRVRDNKSGSTPTLRVESAIAVVVTGRPGLVVDIHSGGWTATCTTGNKPEYGPNACEFGGLRASTYTIVPRGLWASVQVTVDGVGWALVQFDPPK